MFPQENEYQLLLPTNAQGSPNFDKVASAKTLKLKDLQITSV